MIWKYKVVATDRAVGCKSTQHLQEIWEQTFNALGACGWELCGICDGLAVFKKPAVAE